MSINWSVVDNYYSRIAHFYDATRPLPKSVSEKIADCILQLVEATPKKKFLEPGIGTGRTGLPIILLRLFLYRDWHLSRNDGRIKA